MWWLLFGMAALLIVVLIQDSEKRSGWRRVEGRRTRLLEEGDVEGWLERLGVSVTPTSPWQGGTRAVGMGGDLTVLLGCTSFAEFVPSTPFEVRLDLSQWVDPGLRAQSPSFYIEGEEVAATLVGELAWHTLLEPAVASSRRMTASERAYGAPDMPGEPAARDEDLVGLFTSVEATRKLAVSLVFRRLVEAGWAPGPDAAFLIARDGERVARESLLAWLEGRGDLEPYRAALAALEHARVPGAAKLAGTLSPAASDGMLSLAEEDTTRGALSRVGGRGNLTAHDDHATSD